MDSSGAANVLEAAARGASDALSIVGNVAANLICFLAALAFLNSTLDFFAGAVGINDLTLEVSIMRVLPGLSGCSRILIIMGICLVTVKNKLFFCRPFLATLLRQSHSP